MRLTRITLTFLAAIIAVGFTLLTRYLLEDLEAQTLQATEESMVDTVQIMARTLGEADDLDSEIQKWNRALQDNVDNYFRAQIYGHIKNSMGLSFYVTDEKGIILHDSLDRNDVGDDLSKMRDVSRTLEGDYGARSSRLDTADPSSSIMHIAAAIRKNEKIIGVVSLRKAQSDVLPFIEERRYIITSSIILIGLGVLLFTGAVFVWLWQPVGRLTNYARSVSIGERPQQPDLGSGREVNTLGSALFTMRERLEGRNYAETYVQTLTHELKSPIAGIQGAAELLNEDMPTEQRRKFLSNICKETERMRHLIDGLLQLSAIEGQSSLEHRENIDLTTLTREVVDNLAERAAIHQVTIISELSAGITIMGDTSLLRAAIANVLENAIEFSPSGGNVICRLNQDSSETTLEISDQGPGIPDYARDRIFERFYSLDRPHRTHSRSTGLGLPFVKECIALHKGQIDVESSDQGTTMSLRFYT